MRKMILLLNHELNDLQINDARKEWEISNFIYPPADIRELWMGINPYGKDISAQLTPLRNWLESISEKGDYVLVQGEYGAAFYIVDYCFRSGRNPVYSTSERLYEERIRLDGSVERKHIFRHVRFRKYVECTDVRRIK